MVFSKGLADLMASASGGGASFEDNKEFRKLILKPEDGVRYICRILTEQSGFIAFTEHNFTPIVYTKKTGEKVKANSSFFCTEKEDCPVCTAKLMGDKGELISVRPRKVLVFSVYIKETKTTKRGNVKVDEVQETKVIILPPGKNRMYWNQLLMAAEDSGTLTDKYFSISRTGKGLDTVWNIQPLPPSEFEDANKVEDIDAQEVIEKSGNWKNTSEINNKNLSLYSAAVEEDTPEETKEEFQEYSDLSDNL